MSLSVIKYNLNSDYLISEYVTNVSMMNKLTAREYHARLKTFKKFVEDKYSLGLVDLISKIKKNKEDAYSLLNRYARYLVKTEFQQLR